MQEEGGACCGARRLHSQSTSFSTVTPVMPGLQRETRGRCDLSRLKDTWILLEETLMNTVRLFAFVAAMLITSLLFTAVS